MKKILGHKKSEDLQIRSEQLKLVYGATLSASVASFVAACFLAFIQWSVLSHGIILVWLTCMGCSVIARVSSFIAFYHVKPGINEIAFWEKLSFFIMVFVSIVWGAAGIFLFPEGVLERQTATIVMLTGMCAGAASTLAAVRWTFLIFVPSAMLPLTLCLFAEATDVTNSIAIMCIIYTFYLLFAGERNYKAILQNISLRIKSNNEEERIRKSEQTVIKTAEILKSIAAGESASNVYDDIARLYESRHTGMRCSMLILRGNKLLHGGAPSLPEEYCQAVHGLENGPDVGSCGTSTYTGQRVIVADIATDPKWSKIKDVALKHGLRCCWSEPIINYSGKVMGAFGMYYDHPAEPTAEELIDLESAARLAAIIMEREDREQQLRQKNKLEAVGYMAGGMAHNFNNNLAIILGNVELAQLKQTGNSEVISLLENAKIAVRRSRDLVQKIITYSRNGIIHKVPMQLTAIIDETTDLLRSTLPATINLQTSYRPDCAESFINADASQIQEVLINLCNNAVQAMDEKGELKIFLEPVELLQHDIPSQYNCFPGHYVKLSVKDTGCGMPGEMLDKIFDLFFTTKEEYEGAGMGLSTAQGIVSQHGGLIKVDSFVGKGTTFNLYFPLIEQNHLDEPAPDNTTLLTGNEHILFVDDDEMLVNIGAKLLRSMGYQVTMMTDSTAALKIFTANADSFDLVVTDQTMPNLTGTELIHELRKVRPDIPTIICTGYSSKLDAEEAKKLGINAFIMKPLDLPKLLQTIRALLDED